MHHQHYQMQFIKTKYTIKLQVLWSHTVCTSIHYFKGHVMFGQSDFCQRGCLLCTDSYHAHTFPHSTFIRSIQNSKQTVFCALISEACRCLFTAELALAKKRETETNHAVHTPQSYIISAQMKTFHYYYKFVQ